MRPADVAAPYMMEDEVTSCSGYRRRPLQVVVVTDYRSHRSIVLGLVTICSSLLIVIFCGMGAALPPMFSRHPAYVIAGAIVCTFIYTVTGSLAIVCARTRKLRYIVANMVAGTLAVGLGTLGQVAAFGFSFVVTIERVYDLKVQFHECARADLPAVSNADWVTHREVDCQSYYEDFKNWKVRLACAALLLLLSVTCATAAGWNVALCCRAVCCGLRQVVSVRAQSSDSMQMEDQSHTERVRAQLLGTHIHPDRGLSHEPPGESSTHYTNHTDSPPMSLAIHGGEGPPTEVTLLQRGEGSATAETILYPGEGDNTEDTLLLHSERPQNTEGDDHSDVIANSTEQPDGHACNHSDTSRVPSLLCNDDLSPVEGEPPPPYRRTEQR